ncbi:glycogen debranching protein GlgX [Chitinibacter sp. ZOR0017]|uniref:glycogen debranching protein GlgX n=1 Tax=Chitinibacter sp. ZOR0017 TaxID=1339254 RepID=UPI0006922AF3|nr:glycogen debranching protein GlgX [Chitinibacter sp. ZOR0017]
MRDSWPAQLATGAAYPLGATITASGVNFAVFSQHAERIELCLFSADGQQQIASWPLPACTDGVWHGLLPGAMAGLVYGFRAYGSYQPAQGARFNPAKVLLDPYARAVVGRGDQLDTSFGYRAADHNQADLQDNTPTAIKAVVCDEPFAWGDDTPPRTPWAHTVLYEAHVRGLTQLQPQIEPALRGSYAAVAHPAMLAHYRALGVTAIELLPVQLHLDEPRLQALGLVNYWAYNTLGFFAPEPRYWSGRAGTTPLSEFRQMVRDLHAAGLEVILDVVYNHTAEGDALGPTLAFRGLDNQSYYHLHGQGEYTNWSGCGNVLDLSHPRVVQLVLDSLRYWVSECHVDGFRFDLAPILGRVDGQFSAWAPLLTAIGQDPILAPCKLIAEPWDIGPNGYRLGQFPAGWSEWNDQYRDVLRQFWLHGGVSRALLARRFAASSDYFAHSGRAPQASVNFLTAHDGFNLRDLLSYAHKHNAANGEDNRDGHNHNLSCNFGHEGASADPVVQARRLRMAKALLACLLLSQGTPMLLAGDELWHTQQGNNNAYCQNNELTWLNWQQPEQAALCDWISKMLQVRQQCAALRDNRWWQGVVQDQGWPDVSWLLPAGGELTAADWDDPAGRALQIVLSGQYLLQLNAANQPQAFTLPAGRWELVACAADDAAIEVAAGSVRIYRQAGCRPGHPSKIK